MNRTTAAILKELGKTPSMAYLNAERHLLESEHSMLTELRVEQNGAPQWFVSKVNKRLADLEVLMQAKTDELEAERCRRLGIYLG